MAPMTNRVKVWRYFLGLAIETSNFTFEVKVILGLESTHLESWATRMDEQTDEQKKPGIEVGAPPKNKCQVFTPVALARSIQGFRSLFLNLPLRHLLQYFIHPKTTARPNCKGVTRFSSSLLICIFLELCMKFWRHISFIMLGLTLIPT